MECRFEVGQKLICVKADDGGLIEGAEYIVNNIYANEHGVFVCVLGGDEDTEFDGYHPWRFRPLISPFREITRREFDVDRVVKPVKEIA